MLCVRRLGVISLHRAFLDQHVADQSVRTTGPGHPVWLLEGFDSTPYSSWPIHRFWVCRYQAQMPPGGSTAAHSGHHEPRYPYGLPRQYAARHGHRSLLAGEIISFICFNRHGPQETRGSSLAVNFSASTATAGGKIR